MSKVFLTKSSVAEVSIYQWRLFLVPDMFTSLSLCTMKLLISIPDGNATLFLDLILHGNETSVSTGLILWDKLNTIKIHCVKGGKPGKPWDEHSFLPQMGFKSAIFIQTCLGHLCSPYSKVLGKDHWSKHLGLLERILGPLIELYHTCMSKMVQMKWLQPYNITVNEAEKPPGGNISFVKFNLFIWDQTHCILFIHEPYNNG